MPSGETPRFTAESGLGRMAVEMRITWLGQAPAGAGLRAQSWLLHARGKSFSTVHRLETQAGDPVALVELCLVSVDMKSRRAAPLPDFFGV